MLGCGGRLLRLQEQDITLGLRHQKIADAASQSISMRHVCVMQNESLPAFWWRRWGGGACMSNTCMHCSRPMSWVAQLCSSVQRPSRLDKMVSTSSRETGALLTANAVLSAPGLLRCDVVTNIPLTVISRLRSQRLVHSTVRGRGACPVTREWWALR